jgi:hypothetical protein
MPGLTRVSQPPSSWAQTSKPWGSYWLSETMPSWVSRVYLMLQEITLGEKKQTKQDYHPKTRTRVTSPMLFSLNTQKIKNPMSTTSILCGNLVPSGGHRKATSYVQASKLSLWHIWKKTTGPFQELLTSPEKRLDPSCFNPKRSMGGNTEWLNTPGWRYGFLAQPASLFSENNPPANSTELQADWLGFYLPCRHFSSFKVSINSPLMCPQRIFKGLET